MNDRWFNDEVERLRRSRMGLRELVREWQHTLGLEGDVPDDLEKTSVDLLHGGYLAARESGAFRALVAGMDVEPFRAATQKRSGTLESRYLVLLAFFLAAGAYVFHLQRRRTRSATVAPRVPPPTPASRPRGAVLVLVLNVRHVALLGRVREQGRIPADAGPDLYRATQSLWIGPEAEYARSSFPRWFSPEVKADQASEYDVHLVEVKLADPIEGFERGADSIARSDAFDRLATLQPAVRLSGRLPSAAYGTTGVYA